MRGVPSRGVTGSPSSGSQRMVLSSWQKLPMVSAGALAPTAVLGAPEGLGAMLSCVQTGVTPPLSAGTAAPVVTGGAAEPGTRQVATVATVGPAAAGASAMWSSAPVPLTW